MIKFIENITYLLLVSAMIGFMVMFSQSRQAGIENYWTMAGYILGYASVPYCLYLDFKKRKAAKAQRQQGPSSSHLPG